MSNLSAAALVLASAVAIQDLPLRSDLPPNQPPPRLRRSAEALRAKAEGGSHETRTETKHLILSTSSSAPTAAGKRVSLLVDVAPKPKMHIYSPEQDGYIPISLTLEPNPGFTAAKAKYPAGEKILMEILKETQLVYAKPFRITQDVTLKGASAPLTIKGTVRYQACDETTCYLPINVPVQWTITK